ncbi:MAG: hypothetical protein LH650_11250 [Chloroflexi bacterium]|nr:hypothetical protein [Chloroflexota bacterium]
MALPSGYLELQWLHEPRVWWASPDGSTWAPLDLSAIGLTPDLWGSPEEGDSDSGLGVVGDVAFIAIDDRVTGRHMWVLDFDTLPQ